jgi:hypothetical protein
MSDKFVRALPTILKLASLIFTAWAAGNWGILHQAGAGEMLQYIIGIFLPGFLAAGALGTASIMDVKRVSSAENQEPPLPEARAAHELECIGRIAKARAKAGDQIGLKIAGELAAHLVGDKPQGPAPF